MLGQHLLRAATCSGPGVAVLTCGSRNHSGVYTFRAKRVSRPS